MKVDWIRREASARVLPLLPQAIRRRFVPSKYDWSYRDLRTVATARPARVRLLIAPANYGSQGYYWARAAETLPGVSATNLRFLRDDVKVVGPADFTVRRNVGVSSHLWARKQRRQILEDFTHILIEANLPTLSALYAGSLTEEIRYYENSGIKVGLVSHGSDMRLPSKHRALEERSPFHGELSGLTAALEYRAVANHLFWDSFTGPKFVPTPELLSFRDDAKWLPLLTDKRRWDHMRPPNLGGDKITVLHAPSSQPALKGADYIVEALMRLDEEGLINYLEVKGVPYDQMPHYVQQADVVVNQVNMGLYATAAVEAMYAGRLVVADVWGSVREFIKEDTGWDLPIVQANGDTVYDVVRQIALGPAGYRETAEAGQRFALEVHSQEKAAETLSDFLLG